MRLVSLTRTAAAKQAALPAWADNRREGERAKMKAARIRGIHICAFVVIVLGGDGHPPGLDDSPQPPEKENNPDTSPVDAHPGFDPPRRFDREPLAEPPWAEASDTCSTRR
jgi:hypothetical protein